MMVRNTCSEPKYCSFNGGNMDQKTSEVLRTLYPLSMPRRITQFWNAVYTFWFPWRKQ